MSHSVGLNKLSHRDVLDCESCALNGIPLYHTIDMTDPFKLNKSKRMKDGKANLVYSQEFRLNLFNGFWFSFIMEKTYFISSLDYTHQGCFLFIFGYAWSRLLRIQISNAWTLQDRRVMQHFMTTFWNSQSCCLIKKNILNY